MIVQGLSRPLVEFAGDAVEILLAVHGQICSFGEVKVQQAIGVLAGALLPGALRTHLQTALCVCQDSGDRFFT